MPGSFIPDEEARALVPTVVLTHDERLRLRVFLERSDLVRIAEGAEKLLATIVEFHENVGVDLPIRTAAKNVELRLKQWRGGGQGVPKIRAGGSAG